MPCNCFQLDEGIIFSGHLLPAGLHPAYQQLGFGQQQRQQQEVEHQALLAAIASAGGAAALAHLVRTHSHDQRQRGSGP